MPNKFIKGLDEKTSITNDDWLIMQPETEESIAYKIKKENISSSESKPFNNIYYVDVNTTFIGTPAPNDASKPWTSIKAAALAAYTDQQATNNWNQVYIFEGVYNEHSVAYPEIEMFFEDWAIVYADTSSTILSVINDSNAAGHFRIRGKGRFYTTVISSISDKDAVNLSAAGSTIDIEAKELTSVQVWNNAKDGVNVVKFANVYGVLSITVRFASLIFRECIFKNGINFYVDPQSGDNQFESCRVQFPTLTQSTDNTKVYDKSGTLLFTLSEIRVNNQFDTSSQTLQQNVDDKWLIDTDALNMVAAVQFLLPNNQSQGVKNWLQNFSVKFNNCILELNRENSIGIKYNQNGYDAITGAIEINNCNVRSNVTTSCAYVVNRSSSALQPKPVYLDGLVHNCSTERLTSSGYTDNILGDQDKLSKTDTADQSVESNVEFKKNVLADKLAANVAAQLNALDIGGGAAIGSGIAGIKTSPIDGLLVEGGAVIESVGDITKGLMFGDGDTGFYESADDVLRVSIAGVLSYSYFSSFLGAIKGAGMRNEVASDTNPVFTPGLGDDNTGIGWAEDDCLSQIAGGVEALRHKEVGGVITNTFTDSYGAKEMSVDPADPPEGQHYIWQSDGTGSGDDGDIMIKITAGGVTKTTTLIDFSTI